MLIFQQTPRDLRFDPKKFNTLGIKLAKRSKIPVIRVAVKTDAWGNGKTEHRSTIDFIRAKLDGWKINKEII